MQPGYTPYHYCFNDPVNGSDPSGLTTWEWSDMGGGWESSYCSDWSTAEYNMAYRKSQSWANRQAEYNALQMNLAAERMCFLAGDQTVFNDVRLGPVDRDVVVDRGPQMGDGKTVRMVKGAMLDGANAMELQQLEMLYNHVCETSVKEVFDLAEARGIRVRIKFDISIPAYGKYISDDPNNMCGLGANPEILLNPNILTQILYDTYKKPSNWIADIFDGDGFFVQQGLPAQALAHELGHFEDGLLGRIIDCGDLWNREFNSMTRENDFLKFHFYRPKNRYKEGVEYLDFKW